MPEHVSLELEVWLKGYCGFSCLRWSDTAETPLTKSPGELKEQEIFDPRFKNDRLLNFLFIPWDQRTHHAVSPCRKHHLVFWSQGPTRMFILEQFVRIWIQHICLSQLLKLHCNIAEGIFQQSLSYATNGITSMKTNNNPSANGNICLNWYRRWECWFSPRC